MKPVGWAALFIVLVEICIIYYILSHSAPTILFIEAFIATVIVLFVCFLPATAHNKGLKNTIATILYIFFNVGLIILSFGSAYSHLTLNDQARPNSMHPSIWDGIYFSIITLTTVGDGDVTPTLETRALAAFEALTGYIVMGLLISVLVIIAQRPSGGR